MSEPTDFVRYSDAIETVAPDEQDTIEAIIAFMTNASERVAARTRHAIRASHAKSHGLLKGTLVVSAALPEPYRQGLFATARTYGVAIRLASEPGDLLSDAVSTHCGMAIKVFGAEGPKLPGHQGEATQDFLLGSGSVFPQPDAAGFLGSLIETDAPECEQSAKPVVSGQPRVHPLADTYYSRAALRFGDHVAKIAVAPVSRELIALTHDELDVATDPDAFRRAVSLFARTHPCELELRVQLSTDLDAMPVEDAATEWSEAQSPYRAVARILIPAQDAYSPARQAYMDDVMSFRPTHSLAAHRPLGSLMRARLQTYPRLSAFRHDRNGQIQHEPAAIDEIPD
jgi:hypothetical protein